MPITQRRMRAVIDAGLSAQRKLAALRNAIALAVASPQDADAALTTLAASTHLYALEEPHLATLLREDAHFRDAAHRNEREAQRKRERRAPPSAAPHRTAPLSPIQVVALDMATLAPPPPDPTLEQLAREIDEDRGVAATLFADGIDTPRAAPPVRSDAADVPEQGGGNV